MADSRISAAAALAALNAITALVDADASPGEILLFSGSPPADVDAAATGTLLATLTMSATAFAAATDEGGSARALAAAITGDTAANADGTVGYYRVTDGAGVAILQGDVTDGAGNGDLKLSRVDLLTGDPVDITAFAVTLPQVAA